MPDLLIRLLIVVLILWIIQTVLGVVSLREPASKIIWLIALVLGIIYIIFGSTGILIR